MRYSELFESLQVFNFAPIPKSQSLTWVVPAGVHGPITVYDDTPLAQVLIERGWIVQLNWLLDNMPHNTRSIRWQDIIIAALDSLVEAQSVDTPCLGQVGSLFNLVRRMLRLCLGIHHPEVLPLICQLKSMGGWDVEPFLLAPALRQLTVTVDLPFETIQRIFNCGHPFRYAEFLIDDLVAQHEPELIIDRPAFLRTLIATDQMCLRRILRSGTMSPECLMLFLEFGANPNVLKAARSAEIARILIARADFDLTRIYDPLRESVPMLLVRHFELMELTGVCQRLHQIRALDRVLTAKTGATADFVARVLQRFAHEPSLNVKSDLMELFGAMLQAENYRTRVWDALNVWCHVRVCSSALDMMQLVAILVQLHSVKQVTRRQLETVIAAQPAPYSSIIHSLLTLTLREDAPPGARVIKAAPNPYPIDEAQTCVDYIGLEDVPIAVAVAPDSPWFMFSARPGATCCLDHEHFGTLLFNEGRWGHMTSGDTVKLWYFDIPIEQAFIAYVCGARCYYVITAETGGYELAYP